MKKSAKRWQNYPDSIQRILNQGVDCWAPPTSASVSDWAENERYLSAEASAEPGKWRNDNAPHTVFPMECLSPNSTFSRVVCKWSSQSGKTEILNNFVGFAMDSDPGPILVVQPNVKPMGEAWSKDRLAPMIRDTPSLAKVGKIDTNKLNSKDTILHKSFPGGHITVAGANSPSGLASRPIRYLAMDEKDRYEATKEGAPDVLARKRLLTFKRLGLSKELNVSSPTFEDMGIDADYKSCDQQYEWQLQCLFCKEFQFPRFKHFDFNNEDGKPIDIGYTCEHCGERHTQDQEERVKQTGEFLQTRNVGIDSVGTWFNQWSSPFASWEGTISEFLEAGTDPTKLQAVINTAFCECWEEPGEKIEAHFLHERKEHFEHEAPAGVLFITFGTDVQGDRLEMEVIGWGHGEESWSLDYHIIEGDISQSDVWNEHTQLMGENYLNPDGHIIPISAGCVDSSYQASTVYEYVKKLKRIHVWGIKGEDGQKRPFVEGRNERALRLRKRNKSGYRPEILGVDEGKTIIYKRLLLQPLDHEDGRLIYPPGYCHFPFSRDEEYFEQITAETIRKKHLRGHVVREWVKTRERNEALDCRNYGFAALRLANPDFEKLNYYYQQPTQIVRAKQTRKGRRVLSRGIR